MTPRSVGKLLAASACRAAARIRTLPIRRGVSRDGAAWSGGGAAYPAFTLDQLGTLLAWDRARPAGLSLSVVTGQGGFSEVAMVFRRDQARERYLAHPTSHGTVVLVRHPDARRELPTLDAALAKLLELERRVDA